MISLLGISFYFFEKKFISSLFLKCLFYFYFFISVLNIATSYYELGQFYLDYEELESFLQMIALLLFSIFSAALIIASFKPKRINSLNMIMQIRLRLNTFTKSISRYILAINFIGLFFTIIGVGISNFIIGHAYLNADLPLLRAIGLNLLFIGSLASILLFYFDNTKLNKIFVHGIFIFGLLVFFSLDSRRAVIISALYIAVFLFKKNSSFRTLKILFIFAVGIILNSFIIDFRYSNEVGVINLINFLGQESAALEIDNLINSINNITKGGYVFIQMSNSSNFLTSDLIDALNPLPSMFTNWMERSPFLNIGNHMPYNMLGELYFYSPYVFYLYFVGLCLIIFNIEYSYKISFFGKLTNIKKLLTFSLIFALFIMFIIYSQQYNLRACNRYIYYIIFIFLISKIKFFSIKR